MTSRIVTVQIYRDGSTCFVPVPFDPKAVFGKVRAPVRVTLNRYTYRSTIFAMDGTTFIPLRKSHREAAGLEGGETLKVKIELDTEPREVAVPPDLHKALAASPKARKAWDALSYTFRREHAEAVESAKRPETRQRRIAGIVGSLAQK
jgi:hypothetical protein